MRPSSVVFIVPLSAALMLGCTVNQSDCRKNPLLDCFNAAASAGAAGTGATGAGGGSGGKGGGSGGASGAGGACDCSQDPACQAGDTCESHGGCGQTPGYCRCHDGVMNGDETDVDCGGATCGVACTSGQRCGGDADCANGDLCTGGVCCSSSCDGQCHSCAVPGAEGLCVAVPGERPDCNGDQQCRLDGKCKTGLGADCVVGGDCWTNLCIDVPNDNKASICVSCDNNAMCSGGVCDSQHCVHPGAPGDPCVVNAMCKSGFCVDGVCCESACAGTCMGCNSHYTYDGDGLCMPIHQEYDPHGECSGPGAAATCSGAPADGSGNSACGAN